MNKVRKISLTVILLIGLTYLISKPTQAIMSQGGNGNENPVLLSEQGGSSGEQGSSQGNVVREEIKNIVSNKGTSSALRINERLQQRLEGTKLKLCQQKQNMIQTRSKNMVRHMEKQMNVFDKIASRTATFYQDKILASGKSLSNYNTLTTEIQAKKASVTLLLSQASDSAKVFDCTGEKPVANLTQFRDETQATIKAMQEYKQAIKNLIVAIASLVEDVTPSPVGTISE